MNELRKQIDKIDDEIIMLLVKRFEIVKLIGEHKQKHNLKVYDPEREKDIIQRLQSNDLSKEFIEDIFNRIFQESKKIMGS